MHRPQNLKRTLKRPLARYIPFALVGIWLAWLTAVLLAGLGWNLFGSYRFDFSLPGQFGDAFGSLSGLMASLAAAGAWYAVALQRRQMEEQDVARLEDEANRRQQAFEQNFFQLLGHLAAIVRETDIVSERFTSGGMTSKTYMGKDAFRRLISVLRGRMQKISASEQHPDEIYMQFYKQFQDDLGHYFRILFHICNYVFVNEEINREFYLKIVFAQLSNSELLLVAYNCAFGHGQRRFKPIIEKFGCLTNIGFDPEFEFEENLLRSELADSALPTARGGEDIAR